MRCDGVRVSALKAGSNETEVDYNNDRAMVTNFHLQFPSVLTFDSAGCSGSSASSRAQCRQQCTYQTAADGTAVEHSDVSVREEE